MAKIHVKGYFDNLCSSYILRGIPNPLQRVLEFLLLSNCSLSLYLRAFAAADLDEVIFRGSAGRLTTDSVALQFWNEHKRSRARRQYRKNLETRRLVRPILDNISLSQGQYDWLNRHYMKIQMQIELAEDVDCNEEKPVKPVKPVKPTPVEEPADEATEEVEDADMHELKPVDEQ
jgi:hypothetical protein